MTNLQMTSALPQETETARAAAASLIRMHTYCRPSDTPTEHEFLRDWIDPLGVDIDGAGNRIVRIGGKTPKVMWSSHTDTVHKDHGFQKLAVVDGFLKLTKRARKRNSCLGADDTVGVWLMREMILAKVPGLYVFHREEESWGCGSRFIAEKTPTLLTGINAAIAFDRKALASVITHQMMGRCCSDNFAVSLGEGIGLGMVGDSTGSFTDTANYTEIVPECTNVSVGYYNQHTNKECLDVRFALMLREAMLAFDADTLKIEREPGPDYYYEDRWSCDAYGGYLHDLGGSGWSTSTFDTSSRRGFKDEDYRVSLQDLVYEYPDEAADYLEQLGVDAEDFKTRINSMYGVVRARR